MGNTRDDTQMSLKLCPSNQAAHDLKATGSLKGEADLENRRDQEKTRWGKMNNQMNAQQTAMT